MLGSSKYRTLFLGYFYGLRLAFLESDQDQKFEEMRLTILTAMEKLGGPKQLIQYARDRDLEMYGALNGYTDGFPPPDSIYYASKEVAESDTLMRDLTAQL